MLAGLDFETNGVDPQTALPVEVAWVVVEPGTSRAIDSGSSLLYDPSWGEDFIPPEVTAIHGLTSETVRRFGRSPLPFFADLMVRFKSLAVEHVVAHNGNGFDRPIARRYSPPLAELNWIDTRTDVPYGAGIASRRLVHLAADHGFLNPFPHNALADVLTMMRLLAQYPVEEVLRRAASPSITVKALVSYENRDKAKKQRYFWERYDTVFMPKTWLKVIKECDLEAEIKACDFEVVVA